MKRNIAILLFSLFLVTPLLAQEVTFDNNWGPPGLTVTDQSATGMVLNYSVPKVTFFPLDINGEAMTGIATTGKALGNDEDAPNLPGMGRFFALPQGAKLQMEILDFQVERFPDMNIAPTQRIPDENDYGPAVYVKNPRIYGVDAFYPSSPVKISDPTSIRGVDAGLIGVTPFQYNPVSGELLVYRDLKIKVDFVGSSRRFGEDRLRSPYFDPILEDAFINSAMLPQIDYSQRMVHQMQKATGARAAEAEYVIIIPNDATFNLWAKVLKEFRTRQGIKTEIYSLGQTGSTPNAIKNWISNAVQNWSMPPVAVLLLGDSPGSGKGKTIPVPTYGGYTPSDNVYADVYNQDNLPDIVISRITARNGAELERTIMKMINYESNPPTDFDFYDKPTCAMGWQSDRWFMICAEVVRGYFFNALGKRPNREYAGASSMPTYWSTNSNTYMLVDYFGPSGLGYISTVPSGLHDWGGNAARINADFNDGSFFALHRDHGSSSGWSEPHYTVSDLGGLNNTMHPVILSINCSTGAFDGSSECFAEAIHRMDAGAVSVIAASGTSYSFVNDTYVFGMMDSMFPDFDPGYGGTTGANALRPAFANKSGKIFLEASNWPYNPSSKAITYHLFHAHGGAFFTMCSEVPTAMNVSHGSTLALGAASFNITADAGAHIALTVNVSDKEVAIIGTGVATGAPQEIPITPQTEARLMTVTVTKANHFRHTSEVYIPAAGAFTQYGTGLAGTGGYVPDLDGTGTPIYGGEIMIAATNALGSASGLIFTGLSPNNLPFWGGHLLVYPIFFSLPATMGGPANVPGAGSLYIPTVAYVHGATVYLQLVLADAGAPMGVSLSNGLEITFP